MNELLKRQIRRYLGENPVLSYDMELFLQAVDDAYTHYEEDRKLIERSIEISSQELIELNEKWQIRAEEHRLLLQKLIGFVTTLGKEDLPKLSTMNLLKIATHIESQLIESERYKEELKNKEASLRAVFESSGSAIWSYDCELCLQTFNKLFTKIPFLRKGYEPQVGRELQECWDRGQWSQWEHLFRVGLEGTPFHLEISDYSQGLWYFYGVSFSPIVVEGECQGATVYCTDISEQRRADLEVSAARDQAEEASRVKERFLAQVSHELRTPLNAIIGYCELIEEELYEPKKEEDIIADLAKIKRAGEHLLGQVEEILEYKQLSEGEVELAIGSVDLLEFSQEIQRITSPLMQVNSNHFKVNISNRIGHVETDVIKLRQIIMGLIKNAANFTINGKVVFSISENNGEVIFLVKDTGIGIPHEKKEKIFDLFYQGDETTTRGVDGFGIGLSVTARNCVLLGAEISFKSEIGEGTEFKVILPKKFKGKQ